MSHDHDVLVWHACLSMEDLIPCGLR